jgi:hypothetical protein
MFARRVAVRRFLQIVREHDNGDPPITEGDANRAVDQMAHLGRRLLHERAGDIFEQADEVYLLLVMAANRVA